MEGLANSFGEGTPAFTRPHLSDSSADDHSCSGRDGNDRALSQRTASHSRRGFQLPSPAKEA